jgi:hypothetical protein
MTKEQWYPSTPIVYLFSKIQDGVDKANSGNAPYTVNQVLAISFNHFFRTGTMKKACERWASLSQTNKTRAYFQTMFDQAHETYESLTSQAGGNYGANYAHTTTYNTSLPQAESFYTERADVIANLAMAAKADKDLLSTLMPTDAALTYQLRDKDKLMHSLQAQLRNTTTADTTSVKNKLLMVPRYPGVQKSHE